MKAFSLLFAPILLGGCANFDPDAMHQALSQAYAINQASQQYISPPIQPTGFQPAMQSSQSTFSATAYWTGRQQPVQTITYQSGAHCEYNYAGKTFWRTFVGTCPSSVQVQ